MTLDQGRAAAGARARGGLCARVGGDLGPRTAAALALGALALVVAWIGGFVFAGFWWIGSVVVLGEWQAIVLGDRLLERIGLGATAMAVAALSALHNAPLAAVLAVVAGALACGWVAPRNRGWVGGGVIYAGALVVGVCALRASPSYGLPAILWLFAVVWGADVAAYFAGRLIGGPKLWTRVSPGKTWSGVIAGVLAGAVLGLMLAPWTNRIGALFGLGLAAAVVSVLGDLFESAIKRRYGVKDSGRLIPGHGGLMDRLDAFIAASAFAALAASANTRGTFLASGLFQW